MRQLKLLLLSGLLLLLAVSAFNYIRPYIRGRTYYEKNFPYVLTGIYSEDSKTTEKKDFGIHSIFIAFKDGFPYGFSQSVPESSILMITWEAYIVDFEEESILPDIAGGKYDNIIEEFAESSINYSRPLLIRWAHEMNGDWYPWAGINNSYETEIYIEAFRRIRRIFRYYGAENARFIFSVNFEDVPDKRVNRFENYYPGPDYVDYLGLSVYNWGDTLKWGEGFRERSRWRSPRALIRPAYDRLIKLNPDKPILITEVGSSSYGGDKKRWMRSFFRDLKRQFRAVKAFVWFDIDKETDWRFSSEEELVKLYIEETSGEFFRDTYKGLEIFE